MLITFGPSHPQLNQINQPITLTVPTARTSRHIENNQNDLQNCLGWFEPEVEFSCFSPNDASYKLLKEF